MNIPKYYIQGETLADLQEELKTQGWLYYTRCERNSPEWLNTVRGKTTDIRGKELVCIYTHKTKRGYFYVVDFAYIDKNVLTPANLRTEQRKLLNRHAKFQPEFESYI